MFTSVYYVIRSRTDGNYLVAHPQDRNTPGYLIVFRENFDALSYLNTHAPGLADQFAIEAVTSTQLKGILSRWGFVGIGMVQDPLLPRVEFLTSITDLTG